MDFELREISNTDWITILLVASLFLIVIAKELFSGRFTNFIILPFNNKYIFLYNKKDRLFNWFNLFVTGFQLLNFSLFAYLCFTAVLAPKLATYPFSYVLILGGALLYILLKMVIQLANGYIFSNTKFVSELIFKKLTYFNYSSLVMFKANVLLTYVTPGSHAVVFGGIALVLALNAIGWYTILKNYQNYLTAYFFYFILYLCALEIAPVLWIASYLKE